MSGEGKSLIPKRSSSYDAEVHIRDVPALLFIYRTCRLEGDKARQTQAKFNVFHSRHCMLAVGLLVDWAELFFSQRLGSGQARFNRMTVRPTKLSRGVTLAVTKASFWWRIFISDTFLPPLLLIILLVLRQAEQISITQRKEGFKLNSALLPRNEFVSPSLA